MSAMSALVLVVFVAFIHNSFAIKCYFCTSPSGEACDDPFDARKSYVSGCPSQFNACGTGKGTATSSEQKPFLLVRRNNIFVQFIILLFDAILAAAFHLKCVNFFYKQCVLIDIQIQYEHAPLRVRNALCFVIILQKADERCIVSIAESILSCLSCFRGSPVS